MAKTFRIYNHDTDQWEVVAAGNASGIEVNDPRLINEGEIFITVNEALVRLQDRCDELERFIAWLSENGGGGSGGGGGASGGSIVLTDGQITTENGINRFNATRTTNLVFNYLITASRNNIRYLITVYLDGTQIITNQEAYSGIAGTITIPQLDAYSSSSSHSLIVQATNADGITAESYALTIIESSVSVTSQVTSNVATIGLDYIIAYTVSSKVIGSPLSLIVTNVTNGVSQTFDLGTPTTTVPIQRNVNLFDLGDLQPGASYTIRAYATTSLSGEVINSPTIENRVVVQDGENLVVLIDNITLKSEVEEGAEPTKYPQGGNISFAFTPYLAGVNLIYYAVQLEHNGTVREIGTFDPNPSGAFINNPYVSRGTRQVVTWSIPTDGDILGEWDITLRCWSERGNPITDTEMQCEVVASSSSLIDEQNPSNRAYARWHVKQESFPTNPSASNWLSVESNYTPPGTDTPVGANTYLNVYNTNGALSGFLTEDGQSALRFAGEAYGIIDLQPFSANAGEQNNWGTVGFTFSTTFKTDLHPFSDRSVFYIGNTSTDGTFLSGMKIGLDEIVWKYTDGTIDETLSCKIQQNVINSVDFVVNPQPYSLTVKIFVNGVLNAAKELKTAYNFNTQSKIFLGCDADNSGTPQNFADVEFYDIKLIRGPLNDKEIVINSLNSRARAALLADGTVDFTAYTSAKVKNFFSATDNFPTSALWDDSAENGGNYASVDFTTLTNNDSLPIPVMYIDCQGTQFTRAVYEEIGASTDVWYTGCNMQYYDPETGNTASTTDVTIAIQGTSSTGYLSKNLEVRFDKVLTTNNSVELFQPKATWMPENQFTLKADVVDSAHANNASIGKWINENAGSLFDNTPPMDQLEANRPVDTVDNSVHTDVTIKHTLEGFPVIMLIRFAGENSQSMLGIYSFNLGRAAYYNMGFRFFKNFTRKTQNTGGEYVENPVPAFITNYTPYGQTEQFGNIVQSRIYSYEIAENANIINDGSGGFLPVGLFMQDDQTVMEYVGSFRYNGGSWLEPSSPTVDSSVWASLQTLFNVLARMTTTTVQKYAYNGSSYVEIAGTYPALTSWSTEADELDSRFAIRNAYSYFLICTAFGLIDSLGKNMTLRCWNVGAGNKWYPCFYDMDTATGLDNTGLEGVPKTAYIDTFSNSTDPNLVVNALVVKTNDVDGGYDTFSSRMWDVLRNTIFERTGIYDETYASTWSSWRTNQNLLEDVNDFVDNYFAAQTANCGELLFNFDYYVKYLTSYVGEGGGASSYANIEFLHGTRVEYVRDWLGKRHIFFDGVFEFADPSVILPYNDRGSWTGGGPEALNEGDSVNGVLTVKTNAPCIFIVNIGQTTETRYFVPENTPTDIVMTAINSMGTQITINNMSIINELGGLKDIRFQRAFNTLKLPAFAELDLSGVNTISGADPIINFATAFVNDMDYSDIRHIDLSNTSKWSAYESELTWVVDVSKYIKLKDIDISNGVVTSLSLPNASLSSLNITNSQIRNLTLSNQPFLESIDFTGCRRLQTVNISSCDKITTLVLNNLADLQNFTVTGCPNLETIICTGNTAMTTFNISSCPSLTNINLSGCTNPLLNVYLVGATSLVVLDMSNTATSTTVSFPSDVSSITTLNISNSSFTGFQYGNNPVASYNGETVLDLSPMTGLSTLTVSNSSSVRYFKFDNNPSNPFDISASFFSGCTALRRVFGYLRFTGNSVFYNCTNFFIHDMPDDEITPLPVEGAWFGADTSTEAGKTAWANNTDLDTNFVYASNMTNVTNMFRNTRCNLYDVYYGLQKVTSSITGLNAMFYGCTQLGSQVTIKNSWNRNMFKNCGSVTVITEVLRNTGAWSSIMYSPTRDSQGNITEYNGLLSPLVNLTTPNSAFLGGTSTKYIDEYFFGPQLGGQNMKVNVLSNVFDDGGATIVFIEDASIDYDDVPDTTYIAKSGLILKWLPALTNMVGMFNGTNVKINYELETNDNGVQYCNMFYNNPNLTTITRCFRNNAGTGSMLRIFGGHSDFDTLTTNFPQRLANIYNSFIITSTLGTVDWPIHNSMFRKCRATLQRVTGQTAGNASYYADGSFYGAGVNKYFLQEEPDEIFPYEVFTLCTAIIEIPGFFSDMNVGFTDVQLPGNSFVNNTKLTNIAYLYHNMTNVTYSLTGKGFINCALVNTSYTFSEPSLSYTKQGYVPYGLFRMEQNSNTNIVGWSEANAITDGVDENFGIDSNGDWIADEDLPSPLPATRTYATQRRIRRTTITSMAYCLQNFQSTGAAGYSVDLGSLSPADYGDILVRNEALNPAKYILNTAYNPAEWLDDEQTIPNPNRDIRRVIVNSSWSPTYYVWNDWALDGTPITNAILDSSLYAAVQGGTVDAPKTLPDRFTDPMDSRTPNSSVVNKNVMNYILPPDIFRYCTNVGGDSGTNVTYLLSGSGRESGSGFTYTDYGIRGRLCPYLFVPISNITNLEGMFILCKLLNPYAWNTTDPVEAGLIFSDQQFVPFGNSLLSISRMFQQTEIPNNIIIPATAFTTNSRLNNISYTWCGCLFSGTVSTEAQVPASLFTRNTSLSNLLRTFASFTDEANYAGRSPKIVSQWFTNRHTAITNVSYILSNAINSSGTVPAFWDWLSLTSANRTTPFYGMSKANLTNGASIPSTYDGGMNA